MFVFDVSQIRLYDDRSVHGSPRREEVEAVADLVPCKTKSQHSLMFDPSTLICLFRSLQYHHQNHFWHTFRVCFLFQFRGSGLNQIMYVLLNITK